MFKKYIKSTILFLVILIVPICGNWLFLYNNGEFLSVDEIVTTQLRHESCIVGLATRNQGYHYKQAVYNKIKPDVLVLGSSRVMEFRKDFFLSSMCNVGGSMASVQEGYSFVKEAFAESKPKAIILGIDYWWFNENAVTPTKDVKPPREMSHKVTIRSYLLPYKWLWEKKISWQQYKDKVMAFRHQYKNGIGVDASLNKNGFLPDGSYLYTKAVSGTDKSADELFRYSIDRVHASNIKYGNKVEVNKIHLDKLLELINYIKEKDVELFIFVPPIAPTLLNEMPNFVNENSFIEQVFNTLTASGISFNNYHDPSILSSSDCEFIDGIHGGDVLYAKILKNMVDTNKNLNKFVDTEYLDSVIDLYSELAMIPNPKLNSLPEVDFLKIGCNKITSYKEKS